MDQESHSNLAHGTSAFQNNALSHDNSDSVLNAGYSIPGDPSHLQQQLKYGSNAHSLQQIHPGQVSSTSTQGTDLPGTSSNQAPKFQTGAAEVATRVPSVQNPVTAFMVSPSCPVISNHLEIGGVKPPAPSFVGTSATLTQPDRGQIPSSYASQPIAPSSGSTPRYPPSYPSTMTSSSVQNPQSTSSSTVATDPEKRQLIQQQLIYLLHARSCRQEAERSGRTAPCTTPHCRTMRNVLQHMKTCTEGKNCQMPHCASSRQIISHWKNCSSRECPVCEPLKRNQHSQLYQSSLRQLGQPTVPSSKPAEINGLPAFSKSNALIRPPNQLTAPRAGVLVAGTSLRPPLPNAPRSQGPTPILASSSSGHLDMKQTNSASTAPVPDQTGWRKNINMEHRNSIVRRIVKYILPQPDPAVYHDPRMSNLIEYAKKVENTMYTTAEDMDEYFRLLSERCYKIYNELEEIRKRRRNAASAASAKPTSSASVDSSGSTGQQTNLSVPSSQPRFPLQSSAPLTMPSRGLPPNNTDTSLSAGDVCCSSYTDANLAKFDRALSAHNRLPIKPENGPLVHSEQNNNYSSTAPGLSVGAAPYKTEDSAKPHYTPDLPGGATDMPARSFPQKHEKPEEQVKTEDAMSVDSRSTSTYEAVHTTSPVVKLDRSNWKNWSREELLRHFLPLLAEIYNDRNAEPFRDPVDPVALHIPDYPQVIKQPMDLATIRNNLEDGKYKDPWEVLDSFRLMFNNAWLYNKKTSKVYKMCTKLSELFESQADPVMQAMGFCCGHEYSYQQILYCSSSNVCTINRDATYYVYENTPIKKELFERKKNNVTINEANEICKECGRRWHKVCGLHMDEIWPGGFICQGCLHARGTKRKENRFTAKRLPSNKLSTFLEKRVNDFLKKKEVGTGEVTIRVLASSDKTVEVKPLMRSRFTESGELSESFPYRLKAIFAFQEIDGQDVCFFGLYIQEYGSESPQPNRRRVYVAYLDSVFYFRPKQYRTDVYHEILVGYLHYAKRCGFVMAHIWACPPGEGDDYIFHMHPVEQRIPKAKRLQDWYRRMLQKAMIEGIVVDFKDILKDAIDHHLVSPTEIPYFEGDFWPNTLEEILQELDKEERRRREEAVAIAETEDDDPDCSGGLEGGLGDPDKRSGKKKAKKRKGNKKSGSSLSSKRKKVDGPVDGITELSRKVYDTMEKLKEIFFVIRLHRNNAAASLPPIVDPDPLIQSELMESRDSFLQMAREKHLEFSSLRRAKYSTMVMLYELHNEGRQNFMYSCNVCKAQIETRWHCNECEEYDLCSRCYKRENHPHPMVQYGFGMDEDESNANGEPAEKSNSTVQRKGSLEYYAKALAHVYQCRDANCRMPTCVQMKQVLSHKRTCTKRANGTCTLCKQLASMYCYHARSCEDPKCQIPLCPTLKAHFRRQQIEQRRQQSKSLQRRTNLTRGATVASDGSSQHHPTHSLSESHALTGSDSTRGSGAQMTQQGIQLSKVSSYPVSTDLENSSMTAHNPDSVSVAGCINGTSQMSSAQSLSTIYPQGSINSPSMCQAQIPSRMSTFSSPQVPRLSIPTSSSQLANNSPGPSHIPETWRHASPTVTTGMSNDRPPNQAPPTAVNRPNDFQVDASKATPQDIERVRQVLRMITTAKASTEEQNKQFVTWIRRHPEYHAAFYALRSMNQANARSNAQQRQQAAPSSLTGTGPSNIHNPSNPVGLSSTLSSTVPHTNSVVVTPTNPQGQSTALLTQPVGSVLSISSGGTAKQVILNSASQSSLFQHSQQTQQPQTVQLVLQQSSLKGVPQQSLNTVSQQQQQQPQTFRLRTVAGPAVIQSQPQMQVQGPQHVYTPCASATSNSGTVYVGTTVAGGGGGTTLLTTIGHSQQSHLLGQHRLVPTGTTPISAITRTVAAPVGSGSNQPATLVHFRTCGQQPNQHQPHILLTNSGQQGQGAHSQLVTPGRGGPIVAVMTSSQPSNNNSSTPNVNPPSGS
ncbi:unnamed protein product [Schistocephalus solidus]|uniref:histone acetyltransferase n=2 Tax=Schistocephalus solidus TaxID=70667 RepID=A0A183T5M7_SCHSO|nr:unnamed protein product [Schistocephalus solidus]